MIRECGECGKQFSGKRRRGRCAPCYRRLLAALKKAGAYEPIPPQQRKPRKKAEPMPLAAERALSRVTPGWGGCWIYTGRISKNGYGTLREGGRTAMAHRVVYTDRVGPIPDGLQLDHLCHSTDSSCSGGRGCRHRRCINPAHLEPVTAFENNLRSLSPSAVNTRKQKCIWGHEFTPENTRLRRPKKPGRRPMRICRACHREHRRRRQAGP